MIPVHLKIAGLYSYRGMQEIDFRTLTAAHLFGIFGPVGSGKSAILEAILYALYGETERLNSRELRAYNMMNLRCSEALIQFDFLAPGDKGAYRAVVKGKRNSKNKEDVKFDRSLYRVSGEDLIPMETGEITSILGISYENFRRTIIIPQGKFQEFLQLGPKDRTEMVKELFSLHRFDLSAKTGRLQKKNDIAISNCEGRLQQLGEITREVIAEKEAELAAIVLRSDQTRLLLGKNETAESEMLRLSGLYTELDRNRIALNELNAQTAEIQLAETRLNDFDACVTEFKSDIDLLDSQKKQHEVSKIRLAQQQEELTLTVNRLADTEARYQLARQAFDSREALTQQAKELELIAGVNTQRLQVAELSGRIENGEKLLREANLNRESLKTETRKLVLRQESVRAQLPDIHRLQQAKDWFAAAGLLKERIESQRQKETASRREYASLGEELAAIAEKHEIAGGNTATDFSLLVPQLEGRKEQVAQSLQLVQEQLLHLEVQDRLRSLSAELEEGKPCPLCGSTVHPGMPAPDIAEKELLSCRDQKTGLENQQNSLSRSVSQAGLLISQLNKKQPELERNLKALAEAALALQNHEQGFLWSGMTEEKLAEEWQAFSRIQQEIEDLTRMVGEYSRKAETESEKVEKYTEALEKLRIEHGRTQQNAETLLAQVSLSDVSKYLTAEASDLREQSRLLRQQYQVVGEEYAAAEKTKQALSAEVQTLTGMVANMNQANSVLTLAISGLQARLQERIQLSRFGNEAEVRNILAQQPDRVKEQQRIQHFREKMATVTASLVQLEASLAGKSYDRTLHAQLQLEIAGLKTLQDELSGQKGALESTIGRLQLEFDESVKLKATLDKMATRRENLKTLADMFRGQGFVNFVSTLHLQNLVNSANERFYRLTRQQLKLELDAENNFRIRDYLNEGQWRNVKTLSGGQTFQASLCLALALADNIQQLNQSGQNFFFLDEGFGTLDRESLELVFETLKTLRRENRIVGVISHVEDLQQEIAAWLNISRDDEHGSRISRSWE